MLSNSWKASSQVKVGLNNEFLTAQVFYIVHMPFSCKYKKTTLFKKKELLGYIEEFCYIIENNTSHHPTFSR